MEVTKLSIPGPRLLHPRVFADDRGFFFESWNRRVFEEVVGGVGFVQDNHSRSTRGVVRGLHYQVKHPQGKLVRVSNGSIFDVAVDIRPGSDTFGAWLGVELSGDNQQQLWIPEGFAHGFVALEDDTDVLYKTTEYYSAPDDRSIAWNDPDIGIEWPDLGQVYKVSGKDASAPLLRDAELEDRGGV